MDELRLTFSWNSHSRRFEPEPSEQALWADYNYGAGWKNLALQGVENRWIEFGKFIEQQKVYALAETLREQLGNVSCQNPSECLGLLIMHGDIPIPSVSNPSYHNPRVRQSTRLVESHKAYCGNRKVEVVRVLRNNVLSFKLSLSSKENESCINKPTYTYWVEVSPRSVKGCTLVSLKRRNLFCTVLYSDLLRRNRQNHIS